MAFIFGMFINFIKNQNIKSRKKNFANYEQKIFYNNARYLFSVRNTKGGIYFWQYLQPAIIFAKDFQRALHINSQALAFQIQRV